METYRVTQFRQIERFDDYGGTNQTEVTKGEIDPNLYYIKILYTNHPAQQ
jgi:hypothetical protein